MRSYLTPKLDAGDAQTVRRVPIEEPVAVFRRDDNSYSVVAETPETTVDLGIQDAAVSRKKNGEPPVELIPEKAGVRIRNWNSRNPISITAGVRDYELEKGDSELLTNDCIVHLGIAAELRVTVDQEQDSLSQDELEEILDMKQKQDGAVVEGVSPAAHVRAVSVNLKKARNESVIECRKFVTELQNFTADHPVDDPDYDDVCEQLTKLADRLEAKSSGPLKGSELDDEWKERLEYIADRTEKIYSRSTTIS